MVTVAKLGKNVTLELFVVRITPKNLRVLEKKVIKNRYSHCLRCGCICTIECEVSGHRCVVTPSWRNKMQGVCSTYIMVLVSNPDAPSNPPKRKGGSGEYATTILYHYRTSGGTI